MTFLAAPDQKVALLVTPGWANAVPVLPVLPVLWSPQEPKQSLLMCRLLLLNNMHHLLLYSPLDGHSAQGALAIHKWGTD